MQAPTAERPYWLLVTSGMSDAPMRVPGCCPGTPERLRYAELVMALPQDWAMSPASLATRRRAWPFHWLRELATLPHRQDTFLDWGVTWGSPDDAPEPGTPFVGGICLPPQLFGDGFLSLETPSGRRIDFLGVCPLHADEVALRMQRGLDALLDRLDTSTMTELLDVGRPCSVAA